MISIPEGLKGKGKFQRGIHPPENKSFSEKKPIEVLPSPAEVNVPILQHVGAPCEPCCACKDAVKSGQKIAEANAFISAPIHSPINGIAQRAGVVTLPNGRRIKTIPIKADDEQIEESALFEEILGGTWDLSAIDSFNSEEIAEKVREAGIVGQGGAAFPTAVKLMKNAQKTVNFLVVNGCECEPYLTADHRLMLEAADAIICGVALAQKATDAKTAVIAVESNKLDAVEVLKKRRLEQT